MLLDQFGDIHMCIMTGVIVGYHLKLKVELSIHPIFKNNWSVCNLPPKLA